MPDNKRPKGTRVDSALVVYGLRFDRALFFLVVNDAMAVVTNGLKILNYIKGSPRRIPQVVNLGSSGVLAALAYIIGASHRLGSNGLEPWMI